MRPKAEIARLQARIHVLEGQLSAAGVEPVQVDLDPPWAEGLTRQERVLMGVLIGSPRPLDPAEIDDRLPHHDPNADRDLKLIVQVVSNVRKKLGRDAIETVYGEGYRAGPLFRRAA